MKTKTQESQQTEPTTPSKLDTLIKNLESKALTWWKVPKNKLLAMRIVLFIANFLLMLGIFIFIYLNFIE